MAMQVNANYTNLKKIYKNYSNQLYANQVNQYNNSEKIRAHCLRKFIRA